MVSARPPPSPARGRFAYPSAQTYVPGDADASPVYSGSEPIHAVTSSDSDSPGRKQWWKGFREQTTTEPQDTRSVFGIPLAESLQYASVQISTAGPDGTLYVWGAIPVVVAKCGLYLKENATEVEGTFRISGSAKRMRELQTLFDTGPKFGKNIDWKALSFTTHDVATIFRRFLTQMPESIIPDDFYTDFRNVDLGNTPQAVKEYKQLIRAMPSANQHLLLYVLDLLSVFARKSDKNLMNAPNLALIFQPGALSHPQHAMRPREHVLSQQVLEFLIEHQDNFLIGMQLKPKRRKPKVQPVTRPASPPRVKADPDLMLPSDSDDEAPEGGYYVVEAPPRPQKTPPAPTSPTSPMIEASLLPTKPIRPPPKKIIEDMSASDSDEEAPPGGYEIRQGTFEETRAALLGRAPSSAMNRRETMPSRKVESKTQLVQEAP